MTSELESALENHYGFHKKKKLNWNRQILAWFSFSIPLWFLDYLITVIFILARKVDAALKVKRGQPSFFQWYYEEASEQINHLHWKDQPCLAAISHVSYQ